MKYLVLLVIFCLNPLVGLLAMAFMFCCGTVKFAVKTPAFLYRMFIYRGL
jgi:hypothetical protein